MNCNELEKAYLGHSSIDSALLNECIEHVEDCIPCRDHMIAVDLKNNGVNLDHYPCVHMADCATFTCEQHQNLLDCPDALVLYDREFDQYAINDPGPAVTPIKFCPWCGTALPDKSKQWFNELEALGFDEPFSQDIPEKYKSDEWYKNT